MSVEAITWAYKQEGLTGPQKFVLVTLANRGDEAWSCYPSVSDIAFQTALDEKTVRRALDALVALGLLQRTRQRNPDGSLGRYRFYLQEGQMSLIPPADFVPARQKKATKKPAKIIDRAESPVGSLADSVTQTLAGTESGLLNRQSSFKRKKESGEKAEHEAQVKTALDDIWAAWSDKGRKRSGSKTLALNALRKVCSEHAPADIVAAARKFASETDEQWFPGLQRWLKDGRYEHFMPSRVEPSLAENPAEPRSTYIAEWIMAARRWRIRGVWDRSEFGAEPHEPDFSGPVEALHEALVGAPPNHDRSVAVRRNLDRLKAA